MTRLKLLLAAGFVLLLMLVMTIISYWQPMTYRVVWHDLYRVTFANGNLVFTHGHYTTLFKGQIKDAEWPADARVGFEPNFNSAVWPPIRLSGYGASGGQIPVQVSQNDRTVTIEYRQYGYEIWARGISGWLIVSLWFLFMVGLYRSHRKHLRSIPAGLCKTCGYDLRATPDRCPECGTIISQTHKHAEPATRP